MNTFYIFLVLLWTASVANSFNNRKSIGIKLDSDSGSGVLLVSDVDNSSCNITAPKARDDYPYFVSSSVRKLHDDLYRKVFSTLLDEGVFFNSNESKAQSPYVFKNKQEIREIFNFTLPQKRESHESLLKIIKDVIKYSPHASHPYKVNRHGAGLDPYGLVADWMGTTMSTPVLTYLLAPVFTLMEYEVENNIRLHIYGNETGDGMVTHGDGMGKGLVIQVALQKIFPGFKEKGFLGLEQVPRAVLFVSEQASYAYERYAIWEGLGTNAVIRVAADKGGRMSVSDLESKIAQAKQQGLTPFMVVGTAGTPLLGAIDPLDKIGTIAKKNNMWFHVDGLNAGAVFLSEKHKSRINGIEQSDSFLWNADKSLSAPVVTTILVTKEEFIMNKTFALRSPYVFDPSPIYNNLKWDNGDSTLQTTRRPDIVKIWFMWKSKGKERLAQHIDYKYELTKNAVSELTKRSTAFKLILEEFDSTHISFYYVPSSIRYLDSKAQSSILKSSKFTERLKVALLENGVMSISFNTLKNNELQFFVMSLGNSALTQADVNYMFDQIEYYGESIQIPKSLIELHGLVPDDNTTATAQTPPKKPVVPPAPSSFPDFVTAPIESMHREYMTDFFNAVLEFGTYYEEKRQSEPPLLFKTPEDLLKIFDFSLSNSTGTAQTNEKELLEIFKNIIKYSGHLGHPYYNFQLVQGLDAYTLMTDYVIGAMNSQMITYEDNPIFTVMEEELTKAVRKRLGYPEDGEGLILPGGSLGNQIALHVAYIVKKEEAKRSGVVAVGETLVGFVSIGAHFSIHKGAFFMGIGMDNIILVEADDRGRMSAEDLKKKVQASMDAGKIPFFVEATAGTTVFGAFDPIKDIADICEQYGMWFHVDGSYGGSSIMSSNDTRRKIQFEGVERTDSFTFNPHKVFGSTRESTVTVFKKKGTLEKVAPNPSNQEFNNEILYSSKDDPGVLQFFTDRRANVFKMWFLWKAKGLEGLGQHVDYGYALTEQVYDYIRSKPEIYILPLKNYPPDCTNVNFYYVPKKLRGRSILEKDSLAFWSELEEYQKNIKGMVVGNSKIVIVNENVGKFPACIVISLYNSALTFDDVKYMLDIIDFYGADM